MFLFCSVSLPVTGILCYVLICNGMQISTPDFISIRPYRRSDKD